MKWELVAGLTYLQVMLYAYHGIKLDIVIAEI